MTYRTEDNMEIYEEVGLSREVLCAHTNWLDQALESIKLIPQPIRGPQRNNTELLTRYFNLVVAEVLLNQRRKDQQLLNLYHIRLQKIKRKLGQYTVNNKRYYWLNLFEQQPWSLYTTVKLGSNITEENTQVTLNFDIMASGSLESIPRTVLIEHYDQLNRSEPSYVMATPIDLASLDLYIKRSKQSVTDPAKTMAHLAKIEQNLRQAVQIRQLVDNAELIQPIKTSAFGRTYLGGLNLQNCSKTVREAALGKCYSIDFSVCSTAWRLHEAQKIQPDLLCKQTLRLIKDKNKFREDLAAVISDRDTRRAKTILTSIGFGADINNKPWPTGQDTYAVPAIREIIGDYEVEALNNCSWFQEYIQEQQQQTNIILENELSLQPRQEVTAVVKDRSGRISRRKMMAYLYQKTEAWYLYNLLDFIVKHWGRDQILLTVHDCIYTKLKIPMQEVNSLLESLNPYLQAERTEHYGHYELTDKTIASDYTALGEYNIHASQAQDFLNWFKNKQPRTEGYYD